MKRNIKFLSLFLAVLLAFSVFPFNTAYAVEGTETVDTQNTEEFALPDIVPEEEAVERGYIGRVKEEEKDNYTFIFKDSENMRTMRVYSHPVKYTDKDGNTKDITLDIQSRPGGGFETKDNSIKTTFGAKLSDGIRLQSEDVDIKLIPANSLNQATMSEDSKTVSYTLDAKTTLEYSLTYTGFKEDIVVKEYTGQTEYEFLLYTNGLSVKEEMGSFYLADKQGNRKANIGDIIIFTADERNNTLGKLSCIEIKENQIYGLTIHVDAEYLKDEKTVYPIRIDPTLEVTGAGAIEDVTVYTGTSYYSGTSGILYAGVDGDKIYRILMKFPNLDLTGFSENQIINASVELRDVMCQGVHVDIQCRYYNGSASSWSESMINYWAAVCNVSNIGSVIDTKTIYYGNGNVPGIPQRYSFNVTSAAKAWANGTHTSQQGFIFKAADESFSSTEDRLKYFGSYNRSDYQPSLTIQYEIEYDILSGRANANYYIKNYGTSLYLNKSTGLGAAVSSTVGYNRMKWQFVDDGNGCYHIVNADSKTGNTAPYKYALSCTSAGVVSVSAYSPSDVKQKWTITTFDVNGELVNTIESYHGRFLCVTPSGTAYTVSTAEITSYNAFWKIIQCSNTSSMVNETKEYIAKINDSELIDQMNCYAYALGVYHKYDPTLVYAGVLDVRGTERDCYGWTMPKLQMGDICGDTYDLGAVFLNTANYAVTNYAVFEDGVIFLCSLTSAGKDELTNVILDAVEADLYDMYSYSGGIVQTTNDEVALADWRKVALVIDTQNYTFINDTLVDGFGYHWYVQHEDGTWSHKPGVTEVTNYDNNGNIITDPATAARGDYDYFAGYYFIRSDYVYNDALSGVSATSYLNDGAGDILEHANSSYIEIPTTYDKVFYGKIEYGTGGIWRPWYYDDTGKYCEYVYIDFNSHYEKWWYRPFDEDKEFVSDMGASLIGDIIGSERPLFYVTISNTTHSDSASLPCDVDFFEFTVAESGSYTIYTEYYSDTEKLDTYGILYKGTTQIATNDDGGNDRNFSITAYLEKDTIYRVSVKPYNLSYKGRYKLYIGLSD